MNNKLQNEILIEGYIFDKDFEKKSFLIKNNDDVFQFRFNEDFKIEELKELQENEVVRVKGSFDQDEEGIFMMARDFLVMPSFSQGEE